MVNLPTCETQLPDALILERNPKCTTIFSFTLTTWAQSFCNINLTFNTGELPYLIQLYTFFFLNQDANEIAYLLDILRIHAIRGKVMDLDP